MKRIIFPLFLLFTLGCLTQCTPPYDGTIIQGEILNANNIQMFLDKIPLNNTVSPMDNVDLTEKGDFEFRVDDLEPGIYRLRIGARNIPLILNGDEKVIKINADLKSIAGYNYTIEGSPQSASFVSFKKENPGQVKSNIVTDFNQANEGNVLLQMFATLNTLQLEPNLAIHQDVSAKVKAKYPTSRFAQDYEKLIMGAKQKLALKKIKLGELAPDISLPSPDGKNYSLTDLKGQVVLVDFWASWCRPCRITNPALVKVYKKYKDDGFTVFSVSLDKASQKARWEKAIVDDQLEWPYHVSDLKGWACVPAKEWGVKSIPRTFLLDQEGKIAAINPSKGQLDAAVGKLLLKS